MTTSSSNRQSEPVTAGKHTDAASRRRAGPSWFDVFMNTVIVVMGAGSAAMMLAIAVDWLASVL